MTDKATLVAQIVSSYAARPDATVESIITLATRLATELNENSAATAAPPTTTHVASTNLTPETAISHNKVFCLCCGKGFKMLKRHLGSEHGMSEQTYRKTFGLSESYPLVAPSYSERKADYARSVGFGKYARSASKIDS